MTGKTGGGMTSGSGTGAVEGEGHQGMMDKVKAAMGGAPWQVGIAEHLLIRSFLYVHRSWQGLR